MVTKLAQKASVKMRCDRCGKTKSTSEFYPDPKNKLKFSPGCKACRTTAHRERQRLLRENDIKDPISLLEACKITGLSKDDTVALLQEMNVPVVNVGFGKSKNHYRVDRLAVETLVLGMKNLKDDDPELRGNQPTPTNDESSGRKDTSEIFDQIQYDRLVYRVTKIRGIVDGIAIMDPRFSVLATEVGELADELDECGP